MCVSVQQFTPDVFPPAAAPAITAMRSVVHSTQKNKSIVRRSAGGAGFEISSAEIGTTIRVERVPVAIDPAADQSRRRGREEAGRGGR